MFRMAFKSATPVLNSVHNDQALTPTDVIRMEPLATIDDHIPQLAMRRPMGITIIHQLKFHTTKVRYTYQAIL